MLACNSNAEQCVAFAIGCQNEFIQIPMWCILENEIACVVVL